MKPQTTRTLNPLPFQVLEPHRFEDLVRQLAYDFRNWKSLEATGRGGSDDGYDIRGIETIKAADDTLIDSEDSVFTTTELLWMFQCKREKGVGPKRIAEIINEILPSDAKIPYGFVLAISSDVSKAARDAFRDEMVNRKVEYFAIWAKGELEDMLFQPKNDHLLFAYFYISLQPRRRSLSTSLRSQIVIKKQLLSLFDKDQDPVRGSKYLLLRDPTDDGYPPLEEEDQTNLRYLHCRYFSLDEPQCLLVLIKVHPACVTPDRKHWDAIFSVDLEIDRRNHFKPFNRKHLFDPGLLYWKEYVPIEDQDELWVVGFVPLDRILAIDPLGDRYFQIPHIFVEFDREFGPFDSKPNRFLKKFDRELGLDGLTQKQIFPNPIPKLPYPPPEEMELSAIGSAIGLGDKLAADFAKLVADIPRGKLKDDGRDWLAERQQKFQAFRKWRDEVAVPVFAKFVRALREAGEDGRIAIRSEPIDERGFGGSETVELRVCIKSPGPEDPQCWSQGTIGAKLSPPQEFILETPEPDEIEHRRDRWPKMADCNQERLEREVLRLIGRVIGPRSRYARYS